MVAKGSTATPSKSDAVREYLSTHRTLPAKQVAAALAEQGVDVSLALVNKIKYHKAKPSSRRRAQAPRPRHSAGQTAAKAMSKAQAIRDTLALLGRTARVRDVIAHLKAGGIAVTAAQVSVVRKAAGLRGRPRPGAATVSGRRDGASGIVLADLLAAKRLADQVGLEGAKKALEVLARLAS
jgi:hypothetical protein